MEQENSGQGQYSWIINVVIVFAFIIVGFIVLQKTDRKPENVITAENITTPRPIKTSTAEPIVAQPLTVEPTIITEEPTPTVVPAQVCRPPAGWILYTLPRDATLENILEENNLTMEELLQGNCLAEKTITSVDKLFLPPPPPTATPTIFPKSLPTSPPPNPVLGSNWIRPSDSMLMLYVPGGTFMMGSDPNIDFYTEDAEMPQHPVTMDNYWIDRTEVTNEQYQRCVDDFVCIPAEYATYWEYKNPNFPVVGVDWIDAKSYCTWAGGQLPTEAQWEYAARGNDGRIYPWGNNSPNCLLDNVSQCSTGIAPVTTLPEAGRSWVGALGFAGSVSEWVWDWYDPGYYLTSPEFNPTGPEFGKKKIIRGGTSGSNEITARSAMRRYLYPTTRYVSHGFRCVVPGN